MTAIPPAGRDTAEITDKARMDLVEEGLVDIRFHHERGESEPTFVLDWEFGDGDGMATSQGKTFRAAVDDMIAFINRPANEDEAR